MACCLLDSECCLDYLSIIHRNVYRMRVNPDQRAMIKKYLRLVEAELDDNRGVLGPPSPTPAEAYHRCLSGGRAN